LIILNYHNKINIEQDSFLVFFEDLKITKKRKNMLERKINKANFDVAQKKKKKKKR
jgi:hypothetical protein